MPNKQKDTTKTAIEKAESLKDKQDGTVDNSTVHPAPPAVVEETKPDDIETLAKTAAAAIQEAKGANNTVTDQTEAEELAEIEAEIEAEQAAARKQQQAKELAAATRKFKREYPKANFLEKHRLQHEFVQAQMTAGKLSADAHKQVAKTLSKL